MTIPSYALLDSGAGQRLERFGEKILIRPSSLAIWQPRNSQLWATFSAKYDHDAGWSFGRDSFEEWTIALANITLALRLQRNGQIGFFPEHTLYLDEVVAAVSKRSAPALLNLFAYTGMASAAAAAAGAVVTHVDILKPALDWARTNAELNSLPKESLRLIPEEALIFLEREVKRGKRYDIIVLDPPSFSRVSKSKTWDLPEILPQLTSMATQLLNAGGEIFFTSHGAEYGCTTTENLFLDLAPNATVRSRQLLLKELESPRHIAAGYLVHLSL